MFRILMGKIPIRSALNTLLPGSWTYTVQPL